MVPRGVFNSCAPAYTGRARQAGRSLSVSTMKQHTFNKAAGIVFLLATLVHLARIFYGWSASINGWTVRTELSWVVVLVAGYLSYYGFQLAKHK